MAFSYAANPVPSSREADCSSRRGRYGETRPSVRSYQCVFVELAKATLLLLLAHLFQRAPSRPFSWASSIDAFTVKNEFSRKAIAALCAQGSGSSASGRMGGDCDIQVLESASEDAIGYTVGTSKLSTDFIPMRNQTELHEAKSAASLQGSASAQQTGVWSWPGENQAGGGGEGEGGLIPNEAANSLQRHPSSGLLRRSNVERWTSDETRRGQVRNLGSSLVVTLHTISCTSGWQGVAASEVT
ncbi:hypothetical protein R1flu_009231 [Riccia fluitans]|uniref:Uncharacterized protein n=1 Tax=Riccia fluitans TaxID=41844 RepID=A0ABD1Z403_9MARC